jgi:hypothetical protein
MADKAEKPARLHRATFTKDKKHPGEYLIRIAGPTADKFKAGRMVPVTVSGGSEHDEELVACVWSGIETTDKYGGVVGEKVALYTFKQKPREPEPDFDF